MMDLVDEADADKNGKIDFGEWEVMGEISFFFFFCTSIYVCSLKN